MSINATAILLSAGGGTRFSGARHKLLTEINGKTVFEWSLQHLLQANFHHVIVVTGAVDLSAQIAKTEHGETTLQVLHNANWQSGMATSLQCGLTEAQRLASSSVVIGLADQPAIFASSWQLVANSSSPLAVATYSGVRGNPVRGNPVRVHAELWPLLPTIGDEGARSLFKSHKDLLEEIPCSGSAHDLDTTADVEVLRKLLTQ